MEPLSRRTRFFYFVVLAALFLVIAPLAILHASGHRLTDLSFIQTGGVFVAVPETETLITLNGEEVGTTGLFTRSFYIDDLSPGTYVVQASREGHFPWAKTLIVEHSLVTDVSAFLVPVDLVAVELVVGTTTATSTKSITKDQYDEFLLAFSPPATTTLPIETSVEEEISATPSPVDTRSGQALYIYEGDLVLRWLRNASSTPSGFCVTPSSCVTEFTIEEGKEEVVRAEFFGLGALYSTASGNIYFAETDIRPSPLTVKVYGGKEADFRVISGTLVIKQGKVLYEIEGFR